jgi:hypothetical protein
MSAPTLPNWGRVSSKRHSTSSNGATSPYGDSALVAECQRVATAAPGTRNTTLNAAAFSLAQLVAVGKLDEPVVRRRLEGAALAAGLERDEIVATVDSGFSAGLQAPRAAPRSDRLHDANEALVEGFNQLDNEGWQSPKRPSWRDQIFTAAALQTMKFPLPQWVIPDLIPEGLTILAGRPKVGKSWLAFDIAAAVAGGRLCLGSRKPEQGDVLYAALEDNPRRLQRRLDRIFPTFNGRWPERLTLTNAWARLDKGGVQHLKEWADGVASPRLVILDTLAGVKPIRTQQGYELDYAALEGLHRLANDRGFGIVVLHHTRKMEAEDPLDTISGTLGLAGSADTSIVIARSSQGTTLYVRGRDIEEAEHAISFDKTTCRWAILGAAADVQRSKERNAILAALDEAGEAMSPEAIVTAVGMKRGNVDRLLGKMVTDEEILKVGRGLYIHPNHATADHR